MAARRACGKQFYDFLNYLHCMPVARVIRTQCFFLSPKVCFVSQIRCLRVEPLAANNVSTSQENTKTEKAKKKPLWYYDNKGIRQRKIDQLMRKALELNESGETQAAQAAPEDVIHMRNLLHAFSKCDFSSKEVSSLLFNKPRLFGLTKRKLYNSLLDLEDYGYSNSMLKKMIIKSPGMLLGHEKEMPVQKRLSLLQDLKLTPKLTHERITYLVQKCPQLLNFKDISSLQSKVKNLADLGLNQQLVFELVMKYPNVLTYSEKSVKEKVHYVTKELGGRVTLFVKFPRAFSASLKRIKDRHLYLLNEGYINDKTIITENRLRAIVLTTDKDFIYRVANTRMKDFRDFQQHVRKEEAENEFGSAHNTQPDISSRLNNLEEQQDELEDETDMENNDEYNESSYKANVMNAFKGGKQNTVQSDEDWYNTPFPEIDHDNVDLNDLFDDDGDDDLDGIDDKPITKRRTKRYKPVKRKELNDNKSKYY